MALRLVIDTNVLVSAYGFGGKPLRLLEAAVSRECEMVTSVPLLLELARTLQGVLSWGNDDVEIAIRQIARVAAIARPATTLLVVADEPDNRVLECAVEGKADLIVTGDRHLLSLGSYEGIPILPPAEALDLLA